MILYHGSNLEIFEINLNKCLPYRDFGRGFYTTNIQKQAESMAIRRTRINGGTPTIMVYETPDDLVYKSDLNCRVFAEEPTVEWAVFVRNNRERKFQPISHPDCNTDCKYDVVVGPVADDDVGITLRRFSRGIITENQLKENFDFGKLTNQYTFHTEKALTYLQKVGVIYV